MIELRDVTKAFGTGSPALDGVSLRFSRGEFAFITGPSGAGKSTLLRLLYAAERPSNGDVLIEDRSVSRLHPRSVPYLRRNLGIVFQDFKLLPRRSVFDNVALALEVCGTPRREIRGRVERALERVGLRGLADRLPGELSGGEQQRAGIARAIVNEPSIILADEPTGNLDEQLSGEIVDLLVGISLDGATVLVATHDRVQVEARPLREIRLREGRVEADVPVPTVEDAPEAPPTTAEGEGG